MTQRELVERAQQKGSEIKEQARDATRQADSWITPLGRFGFASHGLVYLLVGVLAIQVALGVGGELTSTQGALRRVASLPFGTILLGVLAIGLVGYGLWRIVQGWMDTENKGSDAKGYAVRTGYAAIGLVYLGVAVSALRLALGSGNSAGNTQQALTARLLQQPFGPALVMAIGAAVIGVGGYQLYKAYSARFREELNLSHMRATEETWATRLGRLGFAARGIVFGIVGILLIAAGLHSNASEVGGLDVALQRLSEQPYGPWLLGAVAVGLIAFGLYRLVEARYRRMVMR